MAGDRLDHRVRRRDLLQRQELGLRPLQVAGAQQRGDEPVVCGDLVVELVLLDRVVEVKHGLLRRARVAPEQRAHHVEVERVGHLPVRLALRARLRFGDPVVGDRVRAQVRALLSTKRDALQALHERVMPFVEARRDEAQADAVGLVFVLAGG
jgi:hypothetical protein